MTFYASRIAAATGAELAELFAGRLRQSISEYEDVDHQRCNDVRASWAAQGVIAYGHHLGGAEMNDEIATLIADFLGDMHHLCDALGVSFEDAVNRAIRDHNEEVWSAG